MASFESGMQKNFSHDKNARNDEKVIRLRMRHKAAGYGVYFMLLERLCESKDYLCVKDYNTIAFDLREDAALIKSVIEDFGLFVFTDDGKYFYSETFLERMRERDKSSARRSEAGKKGMASRWSKKPLENQEVNNNVITMLSGDDNTVITSYNTETKESKERKEKESNTKEKQKKVKKEKKENLSADLFSNKSPILQTSKQKLDDLPTYEAKLVFEDVYFKRYGQKPYIDGKEMRYIKELLKKIRYSRKNREKPLPVTNEDLICAFKDFLNEINKDWIYNNFSPTQISTHYNEIISEIKNKRNGKKDRQSSDLELIRSSEERKVGFRR